MAPRATNAELTETTRATLLAVGRRLFAVSGFDGVSAEELVRGARLTRGALYHHFNGKVGLFAAVLEREMAALKARIQTAAAGEPGPVRALKAGLAACLEAYAEPAVRQILLIDGPKVLGWHAWRARDLEQGLGLMRDALSAGMKSGAFEQAPVEVMSQLLCGAMIDAAMGLAAGSNPRQRREVERALWQLIERGVVKRRPRRRAAVSR